MLYELDMNDETPIFEEHDTDETDDEDGYSWDCDNTKEAREWIY